MGWKCDSNQLWKALCIMLLVCLAAVVAVLAAMYEGTIPIKKRMRDGDRPKVMIPNKPEDECPKGEEQIPPNDSNKAVFDELTADEIKTVFDYLQKNVITNLKPGPEATMADPFVHLMEAILPEKEKVLKFLDDGGSRPTRQGKAYVTRGDLSPPVIEVYAVDLPTSNGSHALLETQPFYKTPISDVEQTAMGVVIKSALSSVDHIFKESYEASYAACEDDKCLIWAFMGPHGIASGERRTWCWIMRGLEGEFLHTLGFQVLVYHVTANVSDWYVDQVSVLYIVFY